jgi:hypothetical protein
LRQFDSKALGRVAAPLKLVAAIGELAINDKGHVVGSYVDPKLQQLLRIRKQPGEVR